MNKLFSHAKNYYSAKYKLCRLNDLPLKMQMSLRKDIVELKQKRKKEKKYGAYDDWSNIEYCAGVIFLPLCSCKDDEVLFYQSFFSQESLPEGKRHLWLETEEGDNE